ncbi:MAG: FG-GAP-like repeat-containing protein [Bacteroidota bacterium]
MNSTARRFTQYCFALAAVSTLGFTTATSQSLFKNASSGLPLQAVSGPGMDVEAVDIDSDGDLDIILAQEFAPNVLLLNDGKGNFTHKAGAFAQKNNDSEDIAVADFDGDGDLDVVFVSEDNAQHEFYANDGAGNFTEIPDMLPDSEANAVTVADINNDGFKDLIIGNAGQDFILINKSSDGGKGTWTRYFEDETAQRLPLDESVTQDVEMADIDKDGDLDMICGNEDGDKILVNNGSGIFTDETETRLPISNHMETRKVTLNDVDGDGDLDLYLSNVAFIQGKNAQDRICFNDGSGVFSDKTLKNLPAESGHTLDGKFCDLDGDGDSDLLTCDGFGMYVKAFKNNGAGQFADESATIFPGELYGENLGIEIADLNGDGKNDIYIVRRGEADVLLLANSSATGIPEDSFLKGENAFPNPFKNSTQISCEIPRDMHINASVFDIHGQKIVTLSDALVEAGKKNFTWTPEGIAKGMYFLKIEGENFKSGGILMYSGE